MTQEQADNFQNIKTYLKDMKEYWNIRKAAKKAFLSQSKTSSGKSKTELLQQLKKAMSEASLTNKLKLVLKNSVNNHEMDTGVVKKESRQLMAKKFTQFSFHLQEKVEEAFDAVEDELKLL